MMKHRIRRAWRALCASLSYLNGGAAYAHYCQHLQTHHRGTPPLSRADFYRQEQQRRWNGVRRCC
jgi:uncharacterized short protein YbdD (DUF466 family)